MSDEQKNYEEKQNEWLTFPEVCRVLPLILGSFSHAEKTPLPGPPEDEAL
jgi:hypothetical protein